MILALLLLLPLLAFAEHGHHDPVLCPSCVESPPVRPELPETDPGYADIRLRKTWVPPKPAGDGVGAVRTVCTIGRYGWDDPILLPGKPDQWWHLHVFWGNTLTDGSSTPESLVSSGNSTCRGGIINRSAYWMPAIIDSTDNTVMPPWGVQVYYKTGYKIGTPKDRGNERIVPPPAGMMVATKPGATEYEIRCGGKRLTSFEDCGTDRTIDILIDLPQCWDGTRLTSENQDHLVYPVRGCPASHPVPIPAITYVVGISIPEGRTAATWRLSSDMDGQAGGTSMHADWMNGWMDGREEIFTRDIINEGLSGGSHHAGNGEEWY